MRDSERSYGKSRTTLIPLLQRVQSELGYLPRWALELVSNHLGINLSTIYGIATFYHQFTLEAPGLHVIQLCMGTACYIRGNSENYSFLAHLLGLEHGAETTKDRLFTLTKARCLGCCSLAPVMKVDDHIYGKVDFKTIRSIINTYRAEARRKNTSKPHP
ncbi:MAG: NAD(P)H-dependent oxidoreductase subunit E [Candidatus Bathyarchaeia archaeon]